MKNELMAFPSELEFKNLQMMARNASISGLYSSVGSEEKIFMILLAAREMGISPMRALNGGLWNIKGKIEISARLMNSMIRKAGHRLTTIEISNKICIIEGQREDTLEIERAQFTIQDARDAGIANKDSWRGYTEDMLYARALSRLGRRLFSDVVGEAFTDNEISDVVKDDHEKARKKEMFNPGDLAVEKVEVIVENPESKQMMIEEFALQYPDESIEFITEYLSGYAKHWKRSIKETIDENFPEKFIVDFGNWVKKHKLKPMQIEIEDQADE